MTECRIEQLIVYPVKSMRGIYVERWPLTAQGLQYDRHWMMVMPNGRFVSQRQLPKMALIDTALENNQLILSFAGKGSVSLPISAIESEAQFSATVWSDFCAVQEASIEASSWLNRVLAPAQPLQLVKMANNHQRVQSSPERFGRDTHTLFADAAPFLIANTASLYQLNQALESKQLTPIDMRRFRPNIVISGPEAFTEHQIRELQLISRDINFKLCDHCERCIITTINPDSGEKSADLEPLKTITQLNPMPSNRHAPAFGVNATLGNAVFASLAVGERFKIVSM